MIVFFSSMTSAEGTVQFMKSFADALRINGEEVRIIAEKGICDDEDGCITFNHIRVSEILVGVSSRIKSCVNLIIGLNPSAVIFTDSALGGIVMRRLLSNKVRCILVQHDPEPHPTHRSPSFKDLARRIATAYWLADTNKYIDRYLLLSNTSKERFVKLHPEYGEKCSVMPLCPHPPKGVQAVMPPELVNSLVESNRFFLFFGRIDKYKGIERLLRAYSDGPCSTPLVIAGSGDFSDTEKRLLEASNNVFIVNRYVTDEDLVWLFSHCLGVMLPYIEASQSGVLAMSYHYGKPVAVSNLPGLTEFVIDGKTGFVCNSISEFTSAMSEMIRVGDGMRSDILKYAKENLDWNRQVSLWLRSFHH